jgi:hypothetical protein
MSREPYYDNKRNYSNGFDLLSLECHPLSPKLADGKIDMLEKEVYNVQKSLYAAYIRIKELHDKLHNNEISNGKGYFVSDRWISHYNNVSIKDIDNLQLEFKF